MLIYGSRARHGESFKLNNIPCSYCDQTSSQTMSFFTKYGYLYWIPFIPLGKVSVTECDHCKRTSAEEDYTPALKNAREKLAPEVKSPKWYWAGSAAVVGIFAVIFAVSSINTARDSADYRSGQFKADLAEMTSTPTLADDSLSFYLDQYLSQMINEELDPENIRYGTARYGSNLMLLVSIPYLEDVEDEGREEIIPMLEEVVNAIEDVSDKNLYYGVMNDSERLMLVKTPYDSSYGDYATRNLLYEFYGDLLE